MKRIRNTPRVTISKSGGLGKPKSEPVEAVARVLPKSETRRVYNAVIKRYWWHAWWFIAHTVVRGGIDKVHVALEVRRSRLGTPGRDALAAHGDAAVPDLRGRRTGGLVALASTIGFGWTVLALLGTFVVGLALAGSQVKRQIRRLQSGLRPEPRKAPSPTARSSRSAPCWSSSPAWSLGLGAAAASAADPRRRPSGGDRDGAPTGTTDHGRHRGLAVHGRSGDYIDGEVDRRRSDLSTS